MSEPIDDIDKFFLDNIDPLQEAPPANIWQNVEASLDKDNAEKYKRKAVFFKRLSAALLLLLLGTGIYEVSYKSKKTNDSPAINAAGAAALNKGSDNKDATNNEQNAKPGSTGKQQTERSNIISPLNTSTTIALNTNNGNTNHTGNRIKKITAVVPGISNGLNSAGKMVQWEQPVLNTGIKKDDLAVVTKKQTPTAKAAENNGLQNSLPATVDQLSSPQDGVAANVKPGLHTTPGDREPLKTITPLDIKNKKNISKNLSSPFSLTAFFSPQIAGYSLRDDDDHFPGARDDDDKDKIRNRESHKFSYAAGLMVNYKVADKWTIQTGINISKTRINVDPTTIYANKDNTGKIQYRYNSSSGYAYVLPSFSSSPTVGDSCFTGRSVNSLKYIGIPVNIAYTIAVKKWRIQPTIGVGANFLVHSEIETQLKSGADEEGKDITNIHGLRSVYFNVMASAEVLYPLSKKFSFSISPAIRLALTSINKNNVVQSFTNSLGTIIGINYKF